MSIKGVHVALIIVAALVVANAVVPMIRLPYIQSFFRSSISLNIATNNPFFESLGDDADGLGSVYKNMYPDKSYNYDNIYAQLADLGNLTSDANLFDYTEISYYGQTPLCINNIFKNQKSYVTYKIVYLFILTAILAVVTASYIIIVREARLSNEIREDGNNAIKRMTIKVSIIILSQLICWTSLIAAATFFTISGSVVKDLVYEIFATMVIPANSFINPIIYSAHIYSSAFEKLELYLTAVKRCMWRKRKDLNPQENLERDISLSQPHHNDED